VAFDHEHLAGISLQRPVDAFGDRAEPVDLFRRELP
jgi:hypothetical protein